MGKAHRAAVGLTVAGVCAAGLAFAPVSRAAPVTAPVDCPAAYPTADVTEGLVGTGFTVDKGTTPAPFAAEVLGTISDGVFPGIDLVVARVDSAAIRAAGGVWSGMSGSPVYTSDGRLLGAVAYTLAGATDIAGLTPAEDMLPLLGGATAAARARAAGRSTVAVPRAMAARIARASADGGGAGGSFRRIDLPLSVSGSATRGRATLLTKLAARLPDARVVPGGARAAAAPGDPGSITAGSNVVAALAHGDVTIAGTGTTTVVCDGRAVAFGHPFTFSSPVTMSAHAGSAVLVQPDPVKGPFKVVNPGGVVGTVDTDGITGIAGTLGAVPAGTAVTASVTRVGGATVTGASVAVHEPVLPDVVANQLFVTALKAFGTESAGTARVTTTITGVRAGGAAFTLRYADRYADTQSVPLAAAEAAYATVSRLVAQEFEDVRITRVDLAGSVDPVVKRYTVTRVQVKQGSRYVTPGSDGISVVPGRALAVRVTLATYKNRGPARTVDLSVKVPARARDRVGVLLVTAGRLDGAEGEGEGDDEAMGSPAGPTSFAALLAELRSAQRGYQLRAVLDLEGRAGDAVAVSDQSVAFLPFGDAWSVEP